MNERPQIVLDVGNCGPDHAAIRTMLSRLFDVEVHKANAWADTKASLEDRGANLILVNRKLDVDYSDGIEILRQLKQDPRWVDIPVMLITNHEEHQQLAMQAGAVRGFGKLQLNDSSTRERLAHHLPVKS